VIKQNHITYSDTQDTFFIFTKDISILNCYGIKKVATKYGFCYSFKNGYPGAYFSLKDIKALIPDVTASKEALAQISRLKSVTDDIDNLRMITRSGYEFMWEPYDHQTKIIEYLLHYPRVAILAEQGLGKTFIALNFLAIRKLLFPTRNNRALILAPKIVVPNWHREAAKYTDLKGIVYQGNKKARSKLRDQILETEWDFIVTNYELITPRSDKELEEFYFFLSLLDYDIAIFDEGSRLKGHNSNRSISTQSITEKATNRIILSGTISLGNPLDVYMPYTVLDQNIFGTNYWAFKNRYCEFSKYNKHIITGYKNLDSLKAKIDPYSVIATKAECIDLPDRTFIQQEYFLSPEQVAVYNKIIDEDTVTLGGRDIDVSLPLVKLAKLRQVLSGFVILSEERCYEKCNSCKYLKGCVIEDIMPWDSQQCYQCDGTIKKPEREYFYFKENGKLRTFEEFLSSKKDDDKLIVWVYFKKDQEIIANLLNKKKIKFITAGEQDCDYKFESDSSIKVFLGQESQGIGITLNSAVYTYYYSHSLKLEDRLQSLERNYRIGQSSKVFVYDSVGCDTIEKTIIELLSKKEEVKEFIQSKPECFGCERYAYCSDRGIVAFSEKCILYEIRMNAEQKKSLRLRKINNGGKNG